jgi:hypothetical protein
LMNWENDFSKTAIYENSSQPRFRSPHILLGFDFRIAA